MRPILDRVIVRQLEAETMTRGGLHVPQSAQNVRASCLADVIAVGPGKPLKTGEIWPVEVSVGQRIVYHRDAGWDLHVPGDRLMMLPMVDVLAVVE